MTTATQDLTAAMDAARITVAITDGPTIETTDGWQHRKYWFALSIAGEHLGRYPYSAGMGLDTPPSAADMFGAILSDCASVEPYANDDAEEERNVWPQSRAAWPPRWDEWADDLGLLSDPPVYAGGNAAPAQNRRNLRKIADDFREIMSRRALLRDRLGTDRYDALLEIAAEL
jgi:hypothetical protein